MRKRLITLMVLMLTVIMGAGSVSWAVQEREQMERKGLEREQMEGRGHRRCGNMDKDGWMRRLNELKLSDQQQEQVKAIMDSHQSEMQALNEKIDAARKSVHEAINADTFNEQAIRDAHKALAAEMENMAVLRGSIFSEIRPILTPEQLTQLKNMHDPKTDEMTDRPKKPVTLE